jgi:group I intron endonuclease
MTPTREQTACLYQLISPSGKKYIGKTVNFNSRLNAHKTSAKNGKDRPLYRSIRKHGWDNFKKEMLVVGSEKYILDLEIAAIKLFNTRAPNGYNCTDGGDGISGLIHTDRVKQLMSEANMKRFHGDGSEIARKKRSDQTRAFYKDNPVTESGRESRSDLQAEISKRKGRKTIEEKLFAIANGEIDGKSYADVAIDCGGIRRDRISEIKKKYSEKYKTILDLLKRERLCQ